MSQHDIIDNRNEKLIVHILRILPSSERAKFAVGRSIQSQQNKARSVK